MTLLGQLMRMRRKKHLDERTNANDNLLVKTNFHGLSLQDGLSKIVQINFKELFNNDNPIHIEIGCGKGLFISKIAKMYPNINFLAVEKTQNVIVEAMEKINSQNITNVKFLNCSAVYLQGLIPENSIETLYLNFSCPFPKKRDAKHRLTHKNYLQIYENFLKKSAPIYMKTDNSDFFEFTLNSFCDFGLTLKNITFDLHNSDFSGNITTEYEEKFSKMGMNIFRVEALFKK